MRFLKLLLAGLLTLIIDMQALSLPGALSVSPSQQSTQEPIHAAATNQVSRNWSGYSATNGTFTGASGTWQIPQNSTRNYGIDATWVGIGGVNSDDLIQAGTQTMVDGNGQVSYEAFYEVLPNPSQSVNLTINGNDSITASVIKKSEKSWQISLKDNTTGQGTEFLIPYSSSLSSAEWIEEAPSGERNILPLDNFGTVDFSNAVAIENGKNVNLFQANAQAMHMGEGMGNVLAVASVVGPDGKSFSVSRARRF